MPGSGKRGPARGGGHQGGFHHAAAVVLREIGADHAFLPALGNQRPFQPQQAVQQILLGLGEPAAGGLFPPHAVAQAVVDGGVPQHGIPQRPQHPGHVGLKAARFGHDPVQPVQNLGQAPVDGAGQDLLLGREILVQRPLAQARRVGDLLHPQAGHVHPLPGQGQHAGEHLDLFIGIGHDQSPTSTFFSSRRNSRSYSTGTTIRVSRVA